MFGGNQQSSVFGGGGSGAQQGSKNPFASPFGGKSLGASFAGQPSGPTPTGTSGTWSSSQRQPPTTTGSPFSNTTPSFGAPSFGTTTFGGAAQNSGDSGSQPTWASKSTVPRPATNSSSIFGSSSNLVAPSANPSSSTGTFGAGFNPSGSAHGFARQFKCRMCQAPFSSPEELKKHIKAENHFDTSKTQAPGGMLPGGAPAGQQAPRGPQQSPFPGSGDSQPTGFGQAQAQAQATPPTQQPWGKTTASASAAAGGGAWTTGAAGTTTASGFGAGPRPAWPRPAASQDARMLTPQVRPKSNIGAGAPAGGSGLPGAPAGAYKPPSQRTSPAPFPAPALNATAPAFTPAQAAGTGTGTGGPQRTPFRAAQRPSTATAAASFAPAVAKKSLASAPALSTGDSGESGDSAEEEGDGGDHASDADYQPGMEGSGGSESDSDVTPPPQSGADDDDENDDLNFSFSSQESGGSPAHNTRSHAIAASTGILGDASGKAGAPLAGGVMKPRTGAAGSGAGGGAGTVPRVSSVTAMAGGDGDQHDASAADATGTCEDMCPAEERLKRLNENDVHKLEIPHPDMTPGRTDHAQTMVKKFQRSSADHALQIPHLLRTPTALLRSIEYIENELMDRASQGVFDPRIGEAPTALFIYLFVWDRYRMVAKDFTLQQSVLPLTPIWVECHERMARWFILMDHKMQADEDFLTAGHGQQNGEQLNNLLKTLHGYYFRSRTSPAPASGTDGSGATSTTPAAAAFDMPNKAEFVCYFVIFQLGNGGEVSKYLQQLPDDVLNSEPLRFAIEVWGALKTQNFAKYFRLLRTRATLLQACLMHRYVGEVRMTALRKLTRSLKPPGAAVQAYALADLVHNLMFESADEAMEYLEKCGFSASPVQVDGQEVDENTPWEVYFKGQNIDECLEKDKNDRPIMPMTYYMHEWIDCAKSRRAATHVASGPPGFESHYSIAEISRGLATRSAPAITAATASAVAASVPAAVRSKAAAPVGGTVRVRTPMHMLQATKASSTSSSPVPPSATAAASPAPAPTSTAGTAQHATIDKAALRNKLLMSGALSSGRGPKPATSPIVPVNDADIWGASDSSASSATGSTAPKAKAKKKIDPAPVAPAAFGAAAQDSAKLVSPWAASAAGSVPKTEPTSQPSTKASASPVWGAPAAAPAQSVGAGMDSSSWRKAAPAAEAPKPTFGSGQHVESARNAFSAQPLAAPASSSATAATNVVTAGGAGGPLKAAIFGSQPQQPHSTAQSTAPVAVHATATAPKPMPAVAPAPAPQKDVAPSQQPTLPTPPPPPALTEDKVPVPTPRPVVDAQRLKAFEARALRRRSSALLGDVLSKWHTQAAAEMARRIQRTKALYLLFWRQAVRRVRTKRQAFVSELQSIKLVDSVMNDLGGMSLGSDGIVGRQRGLLKRKQAERVEGERLALETARAAALQHEYLLCDATVYSPQAAGEHAAVQRTRSAKTILEVVGRTLQVVKTCQMREVLGQPVPGSVLADLARSAQSRQEAQPTLHPALQSGPLYQGTLCFKVAIVSSARAAGVECKTHNCSPEQAWGIASTNRVRALLANEAGYGFSTDSQTSALSRSHAGNLRKRRGLLARALVNKGAKPFVRTGLHEHRLSEHSRLLFSVLDVCGDQSYLLPPASADCDAAPQVTAVSTMAGTQGAVVVVTLTDSAINCTQQSGALYRLAKESYQPPALLLLVLDARTGVPQPPAAITELSWQDLHATPAGESCRAVQGVIQDILERARKIGPGGGCVLDGLQGAIVLTAPHGSNLEDNRLVSECTQRALHLLAANAAPTPLLTSHYTVPWIERTLKLSQQSNEKTVPPRDFVVDASAAASLRVHCHSVLVNGIVAVNQRVQSVVERLKQLQVAAAQCGGGVQFPAPDFTLRARLGKAATPGEAGALFGVLCDVANLLGGGSGATNLPLPADWLARSKCDVLIQTVGELQLPSWRPEQPMPQLQQALLRYHGDRASSPPCPRAEGFLTDLEGILNTAYQVGSAADVEPAVRAVLEGLLLERLHIVAEALPEYFYAVVDEVEVRAVEATRRMTSSTEGSSDVMLASPNGGDGLGGAEDLLMSPVARSAPSSSANYFGQVQYSQAFPTGFGRSLFAAFGGVTQGSCDSPVAEASAYSKRTWPPSGSTPQRLQEHHGTGSAPQMPHSRGGEDDGEAVPDTEALFTAAFKKARRHLQDDDQGMYQHSEGKLDTRAPAASLTGYLQDELRQEQQAAGQLEGFLERALRADYMQSLSTPGKVVDVSVREGKESFVDTKDPMAFIAACREERERFERSMF